MAAKKSTKKKSSAGGEARASKKCGLCGKTRKLVKTPCCDSWICDDEDQYQLFSFATNSCFRNHRRYTLCGYHSCEEHPGPWQTCKRCRKDMDDELEMYVWYGTNEYNFETLPDPPAFKPTHCSECGVRIHLGTDGYTQTGDKKYCQQCASKRWKL